MYERTAKVQQQLMHFQRPCVCLNFFALESSNPLLCIKGIYVFMLGFMGLNDLKACFLPQPASAISSSSGRGNGWGGKVRLTRSFS